MKKIFTTFLCFLIFNKLSVAQWSQAGINTTDHLSDIKFISPATGFCIGSGGIFKTIDSGDNWNFISSSPSGRKIFFVNSSLGFVISNTLLFKTVNGGTNWTQAFDFSSSGETLRDLYFTSTTVGYIITSFYNNPAASFIYKTTNGGSSWTKTNTYNGMVTAESITFVSKDTGFVVGYGGRIIKTYNAGSTWQLTQMPSGSDLLHVNFPNSHVGYIGGYTNLSGSEILKTTNAGNTWVQLTTGGVNNSNIRSLYFLSVDTGFAVGFNGRAIKTFDGGLTWQPFTIPIVEDFVSVCFTNSQTGFIAGYDGVLLKTTNAGVNGIRTNDQNKFNVFPNPAINSITVQGNDNTNKKYAMSISNAIGQKIISQDIQFVNEYTIDLKELNNGVYFLSLKNENEQIIKKILVQY
ncbi:MAG: T9SS type A sorting domain-containing protein [Bacteroidetes bacterium]|nr:T9SS type A sorting domain-containing protein [Bacteroidota bacterium]